jgi:hypothetical protein
MAIPDLGLDQYNRDARLKPALLCLLPIVLSIAIWFQTSLSLLTGAVGVAGTFGLTFFLSRFARAEGQKVQLELVRRLGALPTTIMLRHRDTRLSKETKERYHRFLRSRGLKVPNEQEEAQDSKAADESFSSSVDYLRELTRDKTKYSLLFHDNIDFGFRRNLRGLRLVSIAVLIALGLANAFVISFRLSTQAKLPWAELALEAALIAALVVWLFAVSMDFVANAGWSYAKRLLAACENIPPPPQQPSSIIVASR